jgi:putative lipoic acid-binding regulatory protein
MSLQRRSEELLTFPCDHVFKAFGADDGTGRFLQRVKASVCEVVPVSGDAIKARRSSQGAYLCVSVIVRLSNFEQLSRIYAALRGVEGLKYLL